MAIAYSAFQSSNFSDFFQASMYGMPGFRGTGPQQVNPDLLDHYAEEMGRGARAQDSCNKPTIKTKVTPTT